MPSYIKVERAETVIYDGFNQEEVVAILEQAMTLEQEKLYKEQEWDFSDWEQVQLWMVDVLDEGYIDEGDEIGIFGGKLIVISPEGKAEGFLSGKGWENV